MRLLLSSFLFLLVDQTFSIICLRGEIYSKENGWNTKDIKTWMIDDNSTACYIEIDGKCGLKFDSLPLELGDELCSDKNRNGLQFLKCKCKSEKCVPTQEMMIAAKKLHNFERDCYDKFKDLSSQIPDYEALKGKPMTCAEETYTLSDGKWMKENQTGLPTNPTSLMCVLEFRQNSVILWGQFWYAQEDAGTCYSPFYEGLTCYCASDFCHRNIKEMTGKKDWKADNFDLGPQWKIDELQDLLIPPTTTIPTTTTSAEIITTKADSTSSA